MKLLVLCFFLALSACAPTAKTDPFADASALADDIKRQADASKAALAKEIDSKVGKIDNALARFSQESSRACGSSNLSEAARESRVLLASMGPNSVGAWGFDGVNKFGTAVLDTADSARKAGCKKVAEDLYEGVLRTYLGEAYAALRQRAQIGLTSPLMARR